jgi:preprotein translocase subunit YajC
MNSFFSVLHLAQTSAAPSTNSTSGNAVQAAGAAVNEGLAGKQGGWWQTLAFFGVMILVFWLLIIRPQQKQRKKQEEFLTSLKSGDKVVTAAGLIGRIVTITGDVVSLELAKDIRVRIIKSQVVSLFTEQAEADKTDK